MFTNLYRNMKSYWFIFIIVLCVNFQHINTFCIKGTHLSSQYQSFKYMLGANGNCISNDQDCRLYDSIEMRCIQCEGNGILITGVYQGSYCRSPLFLESYYNIESVSAVFLVVAILCLFKIMLLYTRGEAGHSYGETNKPDTNLTSLAELSPAAKQRNVHNSKKASFMSLYLKALSKPANLDSEESESLIINTEKASNYRYKTNKGDDLPSPISPGIYKFKYTRNSNSATPKNKMANLKIPNI